MNTRSLTLIIAFLVVIAAPAFSNPEDPPLVFMGHPLSQEDMAENALAILPTTYPSSPKEEIKSDDGHAYIIAKNGPSYHHNEIDIFIHSPSGRDSKINLKYIYWEISKCNWINGKLLFVRVWWGRHWGSDYIYDAETQKMIYSEGFGEAHVK